jgi:hypothetical protein
LSNISRWFRSLLPSSPAVYPEATQVFGKDAQGVIFVRLVAIKLHPYCHSGDKGGLLPIGMVACRWLLMMAGKNARTHMIRDIQ